VIPSHKTFSCQSFFLIGGSERRWPFDQSASNDYISPAAVSFTSPSLSLYRSMIGTNSGAEIRTSMPPTVADAVRDSSTIATPVVIPPGSVADAVYHLCLCCSSKSSQAQS
jgi:hypothetical protein